MAPRAKAKQLVDLGDLNQVTIPLSKPIKDRIAVYMTTRGVDVQTALLDAIEFGLTESTMHPEMEMIHARNEAMRQATQEIIRLFNGSLKEIRDHLATLSNDPQYYIDQSGDPAFRRGT